MLNIIKKNTIIIALFGLILPVMLLGLTAHAQSSGQNLWGGNGLEEEIQVGTGLGNTDPRVMVSRVINIILGFLGIIAVVIILYGGFLWMTAMGDESKIETAKKLILAGVIGLVIILMAFGIAQFVINALYDATNATA